MKVSELLEVINEIAPFRYGEEWDNNGLLVGDTNSGVTRVITALDCHPEVVKEAVENNCNVIIAHHPLIFSKLSTVTETGVGKVIRELIKRDINLIALHTPLDNQADGVSHMIAERLGYTDTSVMLKKSEQYKKLRINVPKDDVESVKSALSEAGVGHQGDYSECFFEYPVQGQFRPGDEANPHIGSQNKLEIVEEYIVEAIFPHEITRKVIDTIYQAHPYEEPAYDIYTLEHEIDVGLGVKAEADTTFDALVNKINEISTGVVNIVHANDKPIRTIGIIGGSGAPYIDEAFSTGIDVLITGDIKYHEAYDAKLNGYNIIDAGHFLESVMIEGLARQLKDKISEINILESQVNTNPFG